MFRYLKSKFGQNPDRRLWHKRPLQTSYDAVIIGGGLHGLGAAYYLGRDHGMTNVAVIERRYIGYGGSGRNTSIVRSNQRSKENIPLYDEGIKLWPELMRELDFNLMYFKCGNLNLAHSEAEASGLKMTIATAQFMGVQSEFLNAEECKKLVPQLDISNRPRFPIFGGMYHPPGGTVRHDAVVWALGKGADKLGIHIHQLTEVQGIDVENGKIAGVRTDKGYIRTPIVLNAAGGYSPTISTMVGIDLPISVLPLQAMVSEPLKPLLHHVVSSGRYHAYASQSLKGEIAHGPMAYVQHGPHIGTVPQTPGGSPHRDDAVPQGNQIHADLDRPDRYDAGYGPDHERQPHRRILYGLRMGVLRLQVGADHRAIHGEVDRFAPVPRDSDAF
jgi:sarcosine oxidase subunit beta